MDYQFKVEDSPISQKINAKVFAIILAANHTHIPKTLFNLQSGGHFFGAPIHLKTGVLEVTEWQKNIIHFSNIEQKKQKSGNRP